MEEKFHNLGRWHCDRESSSLTPANGASADHSHEYRRAGPAVERNIYCVISVNTLIALILSVEFYLDFRFGFT